jgi:hypothetical protein
MVDKEKGTTEGCGVGTSSARNEEEGGKRKREQVATQRQGKAISTRWCCDGKDLQLTDFTVFVVVVVVVDVVRLLLCFC